MALEGSLERPPLRVGNPDPFLSLSQCSLWLPAVLIIHSWLPSVDCLSLMLVYKLQEGEDSVPCCVPAPSPEAGNRRPPTGDR